MPADPRAHAAIAHAVAAGVLPPVATVPCADCGGRARFRHHEQGYAPEHWLAVVPLCGRCHSRRHAEQGTRKRPAAQPSDLFSVRMPRDLHQQLLEVARADDSTLNRTLVVAVRRYVEQMRAPQGEAGPDGR